MSKPIPLERRRTERIAAKVATIANRDDHVRAARDFFARAVIAPPERAARRGHDV